MIGRAALGNPWLIRGIAAAMLGRPKPAPPSVAERIDFARVHFDAMVERYGEKSGVFQMRKHLAWYIRGIAGASSLREQINNIAEADAVRALLGEARNRPSAEVPANEEVDVAV